MSGGVCYHSLVHDILISGSLAYDRIMDFPGLFRDNFLADKLHNISVSFEVDAFSEQCGGTAGNIAYSLSLLGEHPVILGTAGKDFDSYEAHLKKHGVDTGSIHRDADDLTSSAYIVTDKNDNQIAAFHLGAAKRAYGPLDLTSCKIGIVAPGNLEDMLALPRAYKGARIPYLLDPGQQTARLSGEALREMVDGAHVLFGNDYEISLIRQKTGWDEKEIAGRVGVLVMTIGREGTKIEEKGKTTLVRGVMMDNVIDPTGAGDAHRAGFAKGLYLGWTFEQSTKLANTVASFAIEHYGTQKHQFTIEELQARYAKTYEEALVL